MKRHDLLDRIADLLCAKPSSAPFLVGIDGVDGAGKTTLADELAPLIAARGRAVARASIDGFHHPRELRVARGPLSPEGYFEDSFDLEALRTDFLMPLTKIGSPTTLNAAKFDWKTDSAVGGKTIRVDAATIVLFEGVFLFRPELREFWDFRIYVKIDPLRSLERGLKRDAHLLGGPEATREKYLQRYIPGQKIYHDLHRPENHADLVILNDDPAEPSIAEGRSLNPGGPTK